MLSQLIQCTLPNGQGEADVTVTVGVQTSVAYTWKYMAPAITAALNPTHANTNALQMLTITGTRSVRSLLHPSLSICWLVAIIS